MFLIFKDTDVTSFSDPAEAIMGMFMMSLGEFGDLYESFEVIEYKAFAIVIFLMHKFFHLSAMH